MFKHAASEPSKGFTIIEVIVTVAMLAVLVAIAVPSFREAGLNSAATAQINDLSTALNLARSEATKQSRPVRVSAVGGNWAAGWEVATDADRDGAINGADFAFRTGDAIREGFSLAVEDTGGNVVNNIWFSASGRLLGLAQPVVLTVRRLDADATKSRRLCVALSGRVESKKGESACV